MFLFDYTRVLLSGYKLVNADAIIEREIYACSA
jgi:hypothetical protein